MTEVQLDWLPDESRKSVGKRRKESGMAKVYAAQHEEWKAEYRRLAAVFLSCWPPGDAFTAEDVRAYCIAFGLRRPFHPNAWSAAWCHLLRSKVWNIVKVSPQYANAPTSNRRLIQAYRVMDRKLQV